MPTEDTLGLIQNAIVLAFLCIAPAAEAQPAGHSLPTEMTDELREAIAEEHEIYMPSLVRAFDQVDSRRNGKGTVVEPYRDGMVAPSDIVEYINRNASYAVESIVCGSDIERQPPEKQEACRAKMSSLTNVERRQIEKDWKAQIMVDDLQPSTPAYHLMRFDENGDGVLYRDEFYAVIERIQAEGR